MYTQKLSLHCEPTVLCWRRLLRVPGTARRSNPVNLKGNKSWVFFGRTDAETETLILWPPGAKN